MLEPVITTGGLLRVSRTILVTVDTGKTANEVGIWLSIEVRLGAFGTTVSDVAARKLLNAATAGEEVCSDISKAT